MSDLNVLSDANAMIETVGDSSIIEQSKELVSQLRPPDELWGIAVEYVGSAFDASMKLFALHPGVLIIIGATTFILNHFLLPNFKFIPKQLDPLVSFTLAIALYGFIAPFVLPLIIDVIG